jgi:hypothetical protein
MNANALRYESIAAWNEPTTSRRVGTQSSQSSLGVTTIDSPELEAALRRLWSFKDLPQNWNSYGADAIAASALQSAHAILVAAGELRSLPLAIVPTARGGVQLEWKLPDREVEIETTPDRTVQIAVFEGDQEFEEEGIRVEQLRTDVLFRLLHG